MHDRFIGSWQLVPELSLYQFGEPPRSGRYTLEATGGLLEVRIEWVDGKGEPGQTEYGGPMDGSEIVLEAEGAPRLALTRIDSGTLDSSVTLGGDQVAWARRVASADGLLLSVVQTGADADGTPFRNFQVFRRVDDE